ncbi:MAG: T9SS type A sorting domain-containing protein [Prolixibacteraceae bacterium]|nr:T9SS type A sorting domain-containing protein [Prolixibacteraceae bacterium]
MKKQFLLLFVALLLAMLSSWAVDTGPVITISAPNTSTCGILDVPVKVTNFTNVGAISLRLNYNSSILSYQSRELNEKISSSVVNTSTAGTIKLGWNSANAINLSDNEVLFTLHFSLLPASSGGNTDITWGSDFREIAGVGSNPPVYSSTFVDLSTSIPAWPVNNLTKGLGYCTIQAAVNAASADDEIEVSPGTFAEAVTITKDLKLHGKAGEMANTIILAPSTFPTASDPLSNIVTISGAGVSVELSGLTVKGPGPSGCGSIGRGILVTDGATANIHNNSVLDIRDQSFSGCQNGRAIQVGLGTTAGTATISNNIVSGYQKGGIYVYAGSATISGNTITGAGTTATIAQNGICILNGATATISGNTVSGNSFHLTGNASDWGACGILLYQSGAVSLTGGNNLFNNDQNYYAQDVTGAIVLGAETFGASTGPITNGYYITDFSNQNIDASNCTFEGVSPTSASLTQLFAIEDRIWHSVDDQTKTGFVKVKAGNVYVTRTETGAHIQYGIDAAVAGDLVNVQAGDYGIETAANRSVYGNGPHQFGLYVDKNNLTVRGYKSGDVPVANASETAVVFQTGSTSNFGPDGVFVQANGVTLDGLKIGDNIVNGTVSSNKTISVIGDGFTMTKCFVNTSNDEGAVYLSKWDASHPVNSYAIIGNILNNALVSINSGVGVSGDKSTRLIKDNIFSGVATPYLIGFRGWNGASPAQGWITEPVGGAVVTGNAFNNPGVDKYIVARGNAGGYDNTQLNWSEIWTSNTYGNHVVTLANESTFDVRPYSDGTYPITRRISPKIQENVTIGQTGDVVLVSDGTFAENIVLDKNISLLSVNGATNTIIDGVNSGAEQGTIELKTGRDGVTIGSIGHGFTVKGIDGPPGSEKAAIYLQGTQTHITIEDNIIEARGDAALQGEWNAANTYVKINKNVITGQTFNGAVPATGDQWTVPNVARQAVAFGGGSSTTNTGNFIFTNNVISAITGITAIGNGLVTLDLVGVNDISGNTFSGQPGPSAWRSALRVRGSGTYAIKKNSFTGNFNLALERQGTTVDATENWWGHASGPYNDPQNLCGLGKAVTSNVTFRPWYTDEAMTTLSAAPAVPVIETVIPISSTVECESTAVVPTLPIVKDYCGTVLTPTGPAMSGAMTGCEGTKIYTYTYTDALGQQLVWAYTYTIVRTTLPSEIGDPVSTTGGTVECASAATAPTILPVVKDVCGVVIPAPSPEVSSVSCEGTKTFTYRYKDCANKEFVWVYSYTIDHLTAPVVPANRSNTVACISSAVAPTVVPTVADQQQLQTYANGNWTDASAIGQSFTCGTSGWLTKLDLKVGSLSATQNFTLEIYEGNGIAGSKIYSGLHSFTATGWQSLNINQTVAPYLTAGNQYTFWMTSFTFKQVGILCMNPNVYNGGVAMDAQDQTTVYNGVTYPPYSWQQWPDYDLVFKTYMSVVPVVTDVCGNIIPTPEPVISGTYNGCSGTRIYTYNYTDCSGLSTPWVYTYTINPPAVIMPAPQSATVACVSAATKPTPPVVTDNCGRTMTVDEGVASEDPTCNGIKTWTFKYKDCSNQEYNWVYTYNITYSGVLTPPANGSSIVAGSAQAINPGKPANITDACGRTVEAVLVGRNPLTGPECEGTVVWTYRYTACDAITTADWTYTYTIVKSTVSGKLTYNNTSQTPMSGVTLTLTPGGLTCITGVNGDYVFQGLCPGNYTIAVTNNQKPVGGVNSTDAGGANYWSTHWGAIQHVNFLAGDVTGDKFIAADDALAIQNQWVNEVPANPLWSYWKRGETILSNDNPYEVGSSTKPWPSNISITVNGDVENFDIYALCTGDFNGSYNSNSLKSTAQSIVLNSNSSLNVSAKQEFELPVRAGYTMEVGAVSMILQVPSKMVTVLDVKVIGSNTPVSWSVKGDELRIGWNSLTPVKVNENSSLLTLKLRTTDAFTYGEYFDLVLAVNPANELADGKFNTIDGAVLLSAKIGNGLVGVNPELNNSGLSLNNYPNPFKNSTTVDYTIPFDGKVILSLYNQIGQLVNTMVDSNQSAGKYTVKVDGTRLIPGVYVAKLLLNNQKETKVCTVKLVVMK